ncbi:MAG: DUF262 domain-containing protein [Saprospiraceae bacterium]
MTEEQMIIVEDEIRAFSKQYRYNRMDFDVQTIMNRFKPNDGQEPTIYIPSYQRELVWKLDMQSRFIESLILGVPIPPIFASVNDDFGTLEIIDGSQRINTLNEFINKELVLKNLTKLKSLNDLKFTDLTVARQRKIKLIAIRFNIITDEANSIVRADIFDRLNSTGEKLKPSQIRKGAFHNSEFYQFILEMSLVPEAFSQLSERKQKIEEPSELTLRFFAYSEIYTQHEHAVASFLNDYVQEKTDIGFNREVLKKGFLSMLEFVNNHYPSGFNKTSTSKDIPRVRFEAIAVGTHLALQEKPNLVPEYMDWLDSKEFKEETTSDASNNQGKLASRIEFVRDCLLNIIKKEDLTY